MAVYKPTHTDKKNQQDEHSGKGKGGSSILRKKVAQITFIGYLLSTVVLAGAESEAKKLETYIRDNFGIPGNQTSWFKSIKAIRIDGATAIAEVSTASTAGSVCGALSGYVYDRTRSHQLHSVRIEDAKKRVLIDRRTIAEKCR